VVTRIDIGELKAPRVRADGSLIVEALLTRSGVFEYRNDDGTPRFEYRPPAEVFKADSMATFQMVTVTNDHPTEMVDTENALKVVVGTVGENVRKHGDHVAAPLVIFDASTIGDLKGGKQQVSCGYHADMVETPGVTPEGVSYDAIQTNIRGNHVAIVDIGRAGPDARIRMDAGKLVTPPKAHKDTKNMDLIQALQKVAELTVENTAEKARADKAEADLSVATAKADTVEAERDVAQAKVDSAEKARTDADAKRDADINEAVQLRTVAQALVPDADEAGPARFDGKTNKEIKVAVVEAVHGKFDAEKSDDYLQCLYDIAVKDAAAGDGALDAANATGNLTKATPKVDAEDKAYADMMERNRNAGKRTSK